MIHLKKMRLIQTIVIYIIKFYQVSISPFLGNNCRYNPTCSNYCIQSFEKYSLTYATYLSIKRILSCNPFGDSGHDPVP